VCIRLLSHSSSRTTPEPLRQALRLHRVALVGLVALLALPADSLASVLPRIQPQDADEPIHIRADSAELDETAGTVIYRGKVELQQGTMSLQADLLTISLVDEQVRRIEASGDRARYSQQIRDDGTTVVAQAHNILYLTQDELIELSGNAHMEQGPNSFSGGLIRYDMRAGRVLAEADGDEGVRMILTPSSRPD
jgi:lipopolysaccharide export system protein LptA